MRRFFTTFGLASLAVGFLMCAVVPSEAQWPQPIGRGYPLGGGTQSLGIGVSPPATPLHVRYQDSATTTSTDLCRFDHYTTGTAGTNYGTACLYTGEDASGNADEMGRHRYYYADATSGSEDTCLGVGLRIAGAVLPAGGSDTWRMCGGQLLGPAGAVGTPTWSFTGDSDSGWYSRAAGIPTLAVDGANIFECTSTLCRFGAASAGRLLFQNAASTVAAPFITLSSNTDTGIHSVWTADAVSLVTGGLEALVANPHSVASAAGATGDVVSVPAQTVTITGSTNITTATGFNQFNVGTPTYSCASALTVTNAASVYVAAAPTGGGAGPCTLTNAYSVWVDSGTTRLDGVTDVNNEIQWNAMRGGVAITTGTTLDDTMTFVRCNTGGGAATINLPTAVGIGGRFYCVKRMGANTCTLDGSGAETIDGAATLALSVDNQSRCIVSDDSNWIVMAAHL